PETARTDRGRGPQRRRPRQGGPGADEPAPPQSRPERLRRRRGGQPGSGAQARRLAAGLRGLPGDGGQRRRHDPRGAVADLRPLLLQPQRRHRPRARHRGPYRPRPWRTRQRPFGQGCGHLGDRRASRRGLSRVPPRRRRGDSLVEEADSKKEKAPPRAGLRDGEGGTKLQLMVIFRGLDCSALGTVMVSTPFSKAACTPSELTWWGREKERAKAP